MDYYYDYRSGGNSGRYHENRRSFARRQRSPMDRKGIDGRWEHDFYEKIHDKYKVPHIEDEVRIHVENLPADCGEENIVEMFKNFNLVDQVLHTDEDGSFLDKADLFFNKADGAVAAIQQYASVRIDGIPLALLMIDGDGEVQEAPKAAASIAKKKEVLGPTRTISKKYHEKHHKEYSHHKDRDHRKEYDRRRERPYIPSRFLDRLSYDEHYEKEHEKREQDLQLGLFDVHLHKRDKRTIGAMRMDLI